MLLFCSINTQSFAHNKSSSILQFINGKPRDLQKCIVTSIVTSAFSAGTGGCCGRVG